MSSEFDALQSAEKINECVADSERATDEVEREIRRLPNDLSAPEVFRLKEACLRMCAVNKRLIRQMAALAWPPKSTLQKLLEKMLGL